jgi:CRISPR-associated protein (TIGR02710 family)
MPTALICTVGITVDRQNDLTEVMGLEIRSILPELVVFLVSRESRENALKIADAGGITEEKYEIVEFSSAHNLNEIFETTNGVIRGLHARGFTKNDISINFTGGTKVMGSGVVLSAVFHQCQELRYVFEGNGAGQKVVTTTPKAVFAFRDLHISRRLIQEMRFQSASDLLAGMDASLLSQYDVASLHALRKIADAYSHWDNFRHAEFVRTMREVAPNVELVREFMVEDAVLDVISGMADDMREARYSPPMFADMINNAIRRKLEGSYDDAVARVYRALEMLAQWVLKRYDIDSDDLDTRKVPPRYRVNFEAMRSFEDGRVRIGMRKAFELLALLNAEIGQQFEANQELLHFLERRRKSILAHGTHPVERQDCESLLKAAADLLKTETPDFGALCSQLQFPWLRHTCA